MAVFQIPKTAKRTEDLLEAVLAVLSLRGIDTLRTSDKSFHGHFGAALGVFRQSGGRLAELASDFYKDVVSNTYDELDHALIVAEGDGFVKFPNPKYTRLQINITPRTGEQILSEWGDDRKIIEEAATRLYESTFE